LEICILLGYQDSSGEGRGDGTGDKEARKYINRMELKIFIAGRRKYEPPIPTRIGKRTKRRKGPEIVNKLRQVLPYTPCRLKQLRFERIKPRSTRTKLKRVRNVRTHENAYVTGSECIR
jgi:hypothetical protein